MSPDGKDVTPHLAIDDRVRALIEAHPGRPHSELIQEDDAQRFARGKPVPPDADPAADPVAESDLAESVNALELIEAPKSGEPGDSAEDAFDASDQGDANRLAERHAHDLVYMRDVGWHICETVWTPNEDKAANRVCETSSAYTQIYSEELNQLEKAIKKTTDEAELARFARRHESLRTVCGWVGGGKNVKRISACLKRAQGHSRLSREHHEFDSNDWLIALANGTLDLQTRELRPHNPRDLITKLLPVMYDPCAESPIFDAFLKSSVPDEAERAFLQRYAGYSLTGLTIEQVLLFLLGEGNNGKGVFVETLLRLLGELAASASASSFLQSRDQRSGSAASSDIARLRGKRLVTVSEVPNGRELNEQFVKSVTGEDKITARFLHKNDIEFTPKFKIVWSMNDKPRIVGADHGIWRRIILMPWRVVITNPDKSLREKLKGELPGILRWAVEGCADWQRQGLCPPTTLVAAKDSWRAEENEAAIFVDECCDIFDAKLEIKTENKIVRAEFDRWCKRNGRPHTPANTFGRKISQLKGVRVGGSNGKTYYYNIALKNRDEGQERWS